MDTVSLGETPVGCGHPPYIIAEIGSNHNGDMDLCRQLIDAAADAGAQAVKFQSWSESSLISQEEYDRNPEYADKKKHFGSLRDMVRAYQMTPKQHEEVAAHTRDRGIAFCSSAFSAGEVDLLSELEVPFIKIASMDIVNLRLLAYAAQAGRPLVISTGMATLGEVEEAVEVVRGEGNEQIVLLHCVSIYPPEYETIHLRNMVTLREAFGVPVGFSDHTLGTAVPLAAVALGACVIEKHFTLDKDLPGWDHAISADPDELRVIAEEGRNIFNALGSRRRTVSQAEMEKRLKFRRSLVAERDLPRGHVLRDEDLDVKRPGTGIPANALQYAVGRRLAVEVQRDRVIRWEDLE
ncbi:MAG: polysaccharide biosynthesis protein [Actinobacteria bacterium]|nr:polysaccharide biosynthesis protein [Actinomycetota bacterium]